VKILSDQHGMVSGFWMPVALATLLLLSLPALGIEKREINFSHADNSLAGTLTLPDQDGPLRVVLFVHGDGPMERDSYGAYQPLWDAFLEAGFAVYSWDKAGVGESTGDWLSQSMDDRANELIAAGRALIALDDINIQGLGVWGISQAGWVVPMAVAQSEIFDWMIIVSGAINWMDQSRYLTKQRMRYEGASKLEIKRALAWGKHQAPLFSQLNTYNAYEQNTKVAPSCCNQLMSEQRWFFVKKNRAADVTPFLKKVEIPTLVIFGEFDANVDVEQSKNIYRQEVEPSLLTIKTFPNADHGIMPASKMRPMGMNSTLRDIYLLLKIEFLGARAYAPGYVTTMAEWARQLYEKGNDH
jgi:uncharacterized protein